MITGTTGNFILQLPTGPFVDRLYHHYYNLTCNNSKQLAVKKGGCLRAPIKPGRAAITPVRCSYWPTPLKLLLYRYVRRSDIDADHQPLHVTATRPIPRGDVLGFILGRFMPAAEAESILTAAADSPTEIDDLAQHMFSFTVFQAPSSNSSSDKQQQDDEECLGKDITLLADSCAQTNPLAKV